MADIEEIVYSEKVLNFIAIANEYCSTLENTNKRVLYSFINRIQHILPELYSKTVSLPEIISNLDNLTEKYVTEEEYKNQYEKLSGYFCLIKKQLDDQKIKINIIANDILLLTEFLTDIYQDIKDFLFTYKEGHKEIIVDALWECIQNFKEYWGIKLLNSLPVLHIIKYNFLNLYINNKDNDDGIDDKP